MKKEVQLTTKSLTIDDLKNSNQIGILMPNKKEKAYIGHVGNYRFIPMSSDQGVEACNCVFNADESYKSIKDAILSIKDRIYQVYVFDTRKELYQWLAED